MISTTILIFLLYFQQPVEPPIGTIQIGNYFIDKTEVANIHWLEFLYYKQLELDSVEFVALLPGSSNEWYDDPEFRYYPIVLITKEQAEAYCK